MSSSADKEKDKSKVHKLSLKGGSKLVAEFVRGTPSTSQLTKQVTGENTNSVPSAC